mgnify:FL=1
MCFGKAFLPLPLRSVLILNRCSGVGSAVTCSPSYSPSALKKGSIVFLRLNSPIFGRNLQLLKDASARELARRTEAHQPPARRYYGLKDRMCATGN